jgi:hypothetical protein
MRKMIGEVVMLNRLRFREIADYSATPDLAPPAPMSGAEVFQRFIDHTLPYLRETGGDLLFLGHGGSLVIGPQNERWDMAMPVRQQGVEALEDSRLLPLLEAHATT